MLPYAFLSLAAGFAWALAARRAEHRPAAIALTALLASEVVQLAARAVYSAAPRPFAGSARVAFHVGQAAFLGYPAVIAGLCLVVLAKRPAWPAIAAWAASSAALAMAYPTVRGALLGRVYAVAEVVALVTCLLCASRPRLGAPSEAVALALVGILGGEIIGGFLSGEPFASWTLPQAAHVVGYAVISLIQGRELWARRG